MLLYFDANKRYPSADEFVKGVDTATLKYLAPTYIPNVPSDPLTKISYQYSALKSPSFGDKCLAYHLGAATEGLTAGSGSGVLDSDDDLVTTATADKNVLCTSFPTGATHASILSGTVGNKPFNGIDCASEGTEGDASKDVCYDIYQNQ
jgi:hypothetical protein